MSYKEKLRDPRWQKKRLQIFERDNWRCCICGDDANNIQAHHAVYVKGKDPWEYPDYLIQTLCCECHEIRGELTEKIANAVRISLMCVPTERLEIVATELCQKALLEIDLEGAP